MRFKNGNGVFSNSGKWRASSRLLGAVTVSIGLSLVVLLGAQRIAHADEAGTAIPPPVVDEPASDTHEETAVFAGGCFWATQGVFQHVKGVTNAVSGYAGGRKSTAHYKMVGTGHTGHAETVEITYDPTIITYGKLLQIFLSAAHDPTQLNRQGPDVGTEYRSVIFTTNNMQRQVAQKYIAQLNKSNAFPAPIVTKVQPLRGFYPAEEYHQNYLTLHPDEDYVKTNDLPMVDNLKRLFPDLYRDKPVLVETSS